MAAAAETGYSRWIAEIWPLARASRRPLHAVPPPLTKSRALMTAILCENPLVGNAQGRNVTKLRLPGTVIGFANTVGKTSGALVNLLTVYEELLAHPFHPFTCLHSLPEFSPVAFFIGVAFPSTTVHPSFLE